MSLFGLLSDGKTEESIDEEKRNTLKTAAGVLASSTVSSSSKEPSSEGPSNIYGSVEPKHYSDLDGWNVIRDGKGAIISTPFDSNYNLTYSLDREAIEEYGLTLEELEDTDATPTEEFIQDLEQAAVEAETREELGKLAEHEIAGPGYDLKLEVSEEKQFKGDEYFEERKSIFPPVSECRETSIANSEASFFYEGDGFRADQLGNEIYIEFYGENNPLSSGETSSFTRRDKEALSSISHAAGHITSLTSYTDNTDHGHK